MNLLARLRLDRAFDILHKGANAGAILSLAGMIAVVALQVFARFGLQNAPAWTEEASRFLFLYMVGFGLAHGTRTGALVRLDLFGGNPDSRARRALRASIELAVAGLSLFLCIYAWRFAANGATERSPALNLPMTTALASALLMLLSVALFSIERFLKEVRPRTTA